MRMSNGRRGELAKERCPKRICIFNHGKPKNMPGNVPAESIPWPTRENQRRSLHPNEFGSSENTVLLKGNISHRYRGIQKTREKRKHKNKKTKYQF
jgi:hypothetical protein